MTFFFLKKHPRLIWPHIKMFSNLCVSTQMRPQWEPLVQPVRPRWGRSSIIRLPEVNEAGLYPLRCFSAASGRRFQEPPPHLPPAFFPDCFTFPPDLLNITFSYVRCVLKTYGSILLFCFFKAIFFMIYPKSFLGLQIHFLFLLQHPFALTYCRWHCNHNMLHCVSSVSL